MSVWSIEIFGCEWDTGFGKADVFENLKPTDQTWRHGHGIWAPGRPDSVAMMAANAPSVLGWAVCSARKPGPAPRMCQMRAEMCRPVSRSARHGSLGAVLQNWPPRRRESTEQIHRQSAKISFSHKRSALAKQTRIENASSLSRKEILGITVPIGGPITHRSRTRLEALSRRLI